MTHVSPAKYGNDKGNFVTISICCTILIFFLILIDKLTRQIFIPSFLTIYIIIIYTPSWTGFTKFPRFKGFIICSWPVLQVLNPGRLVKSEKVTFEETIELISLVCCNREKCNASKTMGNRKMRNVCSSYISIDVHNSPSKYLKFRLLVTNIRINRFDGVDFWL